MGGGSGGGFVMVYGPEWWAVRVVAAEGARIGFMPCVVCGAAVMVDPADDVNRVEQHREWHERRDTGG